MPLTSPTSIASCSQPNASASALPLDAPNSGELSSPSDAGDSGLIREAADLILRHTAGTGVFPSAVPGLTLYRLASNDFIERSAGEVMTSFIVQGHKTTAIGGRLLEYGPGESLVCGIASPSEFHPIDASSEHPFLAISVSLDPAVLMEYAGALSALGQPKPKTQTPAGVFVIRPDEELACAFVSLLRLLDRPKLLAIRAPLLMRDLHALLLDSSCGEALRALASAGSEGHAVLNAANWIRSNYAERCSMETLAERANLSSATFYRRFRELTGFSPVQFRMRVRLFEARRLLLSKRSNVSSTAFRVGYDSAAQFVHDYKRLFGDAPLRDIKRLLSSADETSSAADDR